MYMYQSMHHVTLFIVITVFFLLLFSLRTNPFHAAGMFVQEIFTSRKFLFHFAAVMAILFFNKVEMWIEKSMHQQADFTSSVHNLEGDFVAFVQNFFRNDILTAVSTYFYVVVFTSLMIASIGIYTYQKNYKLFYALCYALMFNYMLAIPFYLFFPVNEVWYFHPNVDLLILDVFPSFETDYRPLSGLDNCFPSLHTSISVTLAVLASKSKNVFWSRFTKVSAAFIIFSIFYLGIHWLTDMCAGLVLGLFAARLALRISEGRQIIGNLATSNRLKERNIGE